ncbi:MAG: VOC family protein [Verrucomicrobiales bacterium]
MKVEKVKYVLWVKDMDKAISFYRDLFGGEVSIQTETWSEVVVCGSNIGLHSDGSGERTWTGLSFQLEDLLSGIEELKAAGGDLTSEPNDTPEDPLHLAMCVDLDGNEFMMTQRREH